MATAVSRVTEASTLLLSQRIKIRHVCAPHACWHAAAILHQQGHASIEHARQRHMLMLMPVLVLFLKSVSLAPMSSAGMLTRLLPREHQGYAGDVAADFFS